MTQPWPFERLVGTWGPPSDAPSWLAFAASMALLGVFVVETWWPETLAPRFALRGKRQRRVVLLVAWFAAAFLSLGYIATYLRGGPRIIDATTYYLQGRALSEGHFHWPVVGPSASVRGRFLLYRDGEMGGIFPPGYPLLLAMGFRLGAPLIVGPLLAGCLAIATYALTHELWRLPNIAPNIAPNVEPNVTCPRPRWPWGPATGPSISQATTSSDFFRDDGPPLLALGLSLTSAALRYHTADTMAHGASALGVTIALWSGLRGLREERRPDAYFAIAGLALGYVAATRLVSFLPILGVVGFLVAMKKRASSVGALGLGILPGFALLLAAQGAVTGSLFRSTQWAYYAMSDGPPGCFRYGFGSSIGCLLEHGEFVQKALPHGHGPYEALRLTGLRLFQHVSDAANWGPLFLLVPLAALGCRSPVFFTILALIPLHVLAYAPFYFDGGYPGGGARFFADILPTEHAFMALAVARLGEARTFLRRGALVLLASLLAFALSKSADHRQLASREGGRPYFEPEALTASSVDYGLVFFDTDHGFNLAYQPNANPRDSVVAARLRHDSRDRLLFDKLGHPDSYVYRIEPSGPTLLPWRPDPHLASGENYRFEAEAEWPPLRQDQGWAAPRWASGTCASQGRVLALMARGSHSAEMWLELPWPTHGAWAVVPRLFFTGAGGKARLEVHERLPGEGQEMGAPLAAWETADPTSETITAPGTASCRYLAPTTVFSQGENLWVRVTGSNGASSETDRVLVSLDAIDVEPGTR